MSDKRHLYLPPQVDIWQVDPRPEGGPTAYYMVLVDTSPDIQRKQVAFILNVDQKTGALTVEPYTPQDYDYTIHDGCDHENDDCIEDDPDFQQKMYEDSKLAETAKRLAILQEQLRQQVILERLIEKKQQDGNILMMLDEVPDLMKKQQDHEEENRREDG